LRQVLADLPTRRLVRAFRRLGRDEFYALAEALVRIDPTVPDAVLLIPTARSGPAAAGGMAQDAAGVTGPVSWLLGAALEVRANNHGRRDGSPRGGHLFEATVRPTVELVLTAYPRPVRRKTDPETGLPLLDP
jgi:hypothetical protein